MRSSFVMSLIGAASMAAALLAGCGDNDAKPASSQAGQSCVRTADCADGLSCIANVCYKTAPSNGGSGGDAGTTGAAPGPVLGGPGESCTSRRDCEDGLACFNQRCGTATTGEGGGNGATTQLGAIGETCRVNADCTTGLVCIPSTTGAGIGVCDQPNNGFKSTGKSCVGECKTAADCCEMPYNEELGNNVSSCADITTRLGTTNCATTTDTDMQKLCFLKSTFCTCAANTWKCDANSQCVYSAPCSVQDETLNGCPNYTRNENSVPSCNLTTSKCEDEPPTVACKADADCDGKPVAQGGGNCATGECTCYQATNRCYRKCAKDFDCDAAFKCDTKTKVCTKAVGECVNDLDCARDNGDAQEKCVAGQCKLACKNDIQCNQNTNLLAPASSQFNDFVCSAQGFCEELDVRHDCSSDADCATQDNADYRTFCVPNPPKVEAVQVESAISG